MSSDSRRLKAFLLSVLVWLPLAFLGWAVLSAVLAWVPGQLSGWWLTWRWPGLFVEVLHRGTNWQMVTDIVVQDPRTGAFGQLVLDLDPMMYGYSLPLFFGLVMATNLTPLARTAQCAIVLPALWLAQAFGMVTGLLKAVAFDSGPAGAAAANAAGLSPEVVALSYQFGYLIMPAVVPIVFWVVLNRRFIDSLGRPQAEPAGA